MRNNYFIPEPYANENERKRIYKNAILRERPMAKVIVKGVYNWRYYADITIGTVFFELPINKVSEFNSPDSITAFTLTNYFLL